MAGNLTESGDRLLQKIAQNPPRVTGHRMRKCRSLKHRATASPTTPPTPPWKAAKCARLFF